MADPINPGGPPTPGGPPSGAGGGAPLDPTVAAMYEKMEEMLRVQTVLNAENSKNLREQTDALKQQLEHAEDLQSVIKKRVELSKKLRNLTDKDLQDARKTRKELEQMVKYYEDGLKLAQKNSKESREMAKSLRNVRDFLKDVAVEGKLSSDQISKMRDLLGDAAKNTKELAAAMQNLTRTGAAVKGMAGILGSLGVGRGMNRNIERRLEQIQEVRDKIEESKALRKSATAKHMYRKRDKALEEMRGQQAAGGKHGGIYVDPETGEAMQMFDEKGGLTKGGRHSLAERMGFTRGTKKYNQFIGGESAMASGGNAGTGYGAAMEGGGGAIETVMTAFEGGVETLLEALEELTGPMMALAAPIMLLVKVWDEFAKTNQEIEKGVGAGGLFTKPGVGAGQAFMDARNALVPNAGTNVPLGITFERNLALASAMTQSGYNVADSFGKGATDIANKLPGSSGQFMQGSVGEFQRVVMGVSRVSGLTDAQGTENLIKLLQQYRETVGSSEDFMRTLNKDTQAAGISTTKYLKIIDDVSSHFDRMNKSLEEVTGAMRELSRYGAVSSESLKDMMDYLATGQDKTTMGNLAESIYTNMVMPKQLKEAGIGAEGGAVDMAVAAVNAQLQRPGAEGIAPLSIAGMKPDEAQRAVNQKRQEAMQIKDRVDRDATLDALSKVQDQMLNQSAVGGDAMQSASKASLYGQDLIQQTQKMFGNFDEVVGRAGATMEDLVTGHLTGVQATQIQQEAGILGLKDPGKIREMLRTEATNRIQEATTSETPLENRRKFIKQLLTEISRKPNGLKTTLAGSQWEGFTGSIDDLSVQMADNGKAAGMALSRSSDTIGGSIETQANFIKRMGDDQKKGIMTQRQALDTAGDIGLNTQTVEDILKNVIKPLLDDMVTALVWIAKAASKYLGEDFDPTAVQNEIKKIPDAMKTLQAKGAVIEDERSKLAEKSMDDNGVWKNQQDKAHFDDLTKQGQQVIDTLKYLNESGTTGAVSSEKQLEVLHNTLKTVQDYAKGGGKAPMAPTAQDFESSWKDTLIGSPHIRPGSVADYTVKGGQAAATYIYNIFSGETNQSFVPGDSPINSGENAVTVKTTMPTKSSQSQ